MEDQSVEEQHALPIIFQPTNIQLQSQCVTIIASIHADTNKKIKYTYRVAQTIAPFFVRLKNNFIKR